MSNPTVSVTADLRHPISGVAATGSVDFELLLPLADPPTLWGDNGPFPAAVTSGSFAAPISLQANTFWKITVQTDVLRHQFEVYVPADPSSTTLAALWELSLATPTVPAQYIPYSQRGVAGGVATLDPTLGTVPLNQLPASVSGGDIYWQAALAYAGLLDESIITDYAADPSGPITLTEPFYENLRFTCTELLYPEDVKLKNCDVVCSNNDFSVRLDANTGFETGRYMEHCRITGQGAALAGAGFRARLCEVYQNGDDSARVGRAHGEQTVFEMCHFHDYRPKAGAHADGVQILTPPAQDVWIFGCVITMNTAEGYTLPGDAGYTGAVFVDTSDVPIPEDDPEPTRLGNIWVRHCKLLSTNNYTLVIDGPNVDVSYNTLLSGTTAVESIQSGVTVTGVGNVDASGVPLADTDIGGFPTRFLLADDPRITLASLGDVDMSGIASGNVPTWNGAKFLPVTPSGGGGEGGTLAGLSDVDVSGVLNDQVLGYDSDSDTWVPKTNGGGGTPSAGFRESTTGPQLGTFGPGDSSGTPTTLFPSARRPKVKAAVGDRVYMTLGILSNGGQATGDVCSVVNGLAVNYYSDGCGPTQAVDGHGALYINGDFGEAQYPQIRWVVQSDDLDADGFLTLSGMYQAGGSHMWGHSSIPDQMDLLNLGQPNTD